MERKMSSGMKAWMIFVIVANAVFGIITAIGAPRLPVLWVSVLCLAVGIAGAAMLLALKKVGLYILCGTSAVNFIVNLVAGSNFFSALLSCIALPLIIYMFMKKQMEIFE